MRTLRKLSDGDDQAMQDFKESSQTIHETEQRMGNWVAWSVSNCSIHSFIDLHYNDFNSTSSQQARQNKLSKELGKSLTNHANNFIDLTIIMTIAANAAKTILLNDESPMNNTFIFDMI